MEELLRAMPSVKDEEILHDLRPMLVIYKDGTVHRLFANLTVPPSADNVTGVESKDVVINPETGVFVRVYKPQNLNSGEKVPLLIYYHGGGFCAETASSAGYHSYLNALSSKAKVVVVSVSYRLAPEHPLQTVYDDSFAALEWVGKGASGDDDWLNDHADMKRVCLAGDSAGGNITHHMAKRFKKNPIDKISLKGLVLVHPFFWGKDRIGSELQKMTAAREMGMSASPDELWALVFPESSGADDPLMNPAMDPELAELNVKKVLVFVAEQDALRDRGYHYEEALLKSGWKGDIQVVETIGENHVFHLFNQTSSKAAAMMDQFVAFLNSSL